MRTEFVGWDKFIYEHCYLISKEIRSCALFSLPTEIVLHIESSFLEHIRSNNLKFKLFEKDNNLICFIYKYNHQAYLFDMLIQPGIINDDLSFIDQYILGKLLGYSEKAMHNYFTKNDETDNYVFKSTWINSFEYIPYITQDVLVSFDCQNYKLMTFNKEKSKFIDKETNEEIEPSINIFWMNLPNHPIHKFQELLEDNLNNSNLK